MSTRVLCHTSTLCSFQLQYGEPVIRRAVPLALAILSASNPQLSIVDTLSKLSHDNDAEVSHNSIFAMGIVGAGQYGIRLGVDWGGASHAEVLEPGGLAPSPLVLKFSEFDHKRSNYH